MLLGRLMGVPVVTAPCEAEAQCSELARVRGVAGYITACDRVYCYDCYD